METKSDTKTYTGLVRMILSQGRRKRKMTGEEMEADERESRKAREKD